MTFNPLKDALDNGSAINIADVAENGREGFDLSSANVGYFLDLPNSLIATNAQYAVGSEAYPTTGEYFLNMFDGQVGTSAAIPVSTHTTTKYLYLQMRGLYRTRQINVVTTVAKRPSSTLSAWYNAGAGSPGVPPTTGWTQLTVIGTWNPNSGYVFQAPLGALFDANWIRIETDDNIGAEL